MQKKDAHTIIDRAIALALGTAIGDAKGIAYENLTRQQVIDLQKDRSPSQYARVSGLNPYIPRDWPPGRWTDDTQLTLAMMRALTKYIQGGDLMSHIVAEHVVEWRECVDGWGGTKNAIERLALGTHTYENSGNTADGNGVLMKLAPLAFYYYTAGKVDDDEIEMICRMTHNSSVAQATACVFVRMYVHLFEHALQPVDFLHFVLELALKYEKKHNVIVEKQLLSRRIQQYLAAMNSPSGVDENVLIDISEGGTYYCVNSLAMVIGLIITSPHGRPDFNTLIRATEIGGDTDSNAAMVGALIGASQGQSAIDPQYLDGLYRCEDVRKVGDDFGRALAHNFADKDSS